MPPADARGRVVNGSERAVATTLSSPGYPAGVARTIDIHTHHYTPAYFEAVRQSRGDYSFASAPNGQPIITLRGARFFGVTPAMTDMAQRLETMDRYAVEVAVLSLSTPNVFFLGPDEQPALARQMNDAYAAEMAAHPD